MYKHTVLDEASLFTKYRRLDKAGGLGSFHPFFAEMMVELCAMMMMLPTHVLLQILNVWRKL